MEKNIYFKIIFSSTIVLALIVGMGLILHWVRSAPRLESTRNPSHSPLYEPGDRPTTIFLKEVEVENGRMVNVAATIHESKIRENQMQQAVLAYLQGPRTGWAQVPVPDGMSLNEFYFTAEGAAVVDLAIDQVKKENVGFYDEALFVRGLIETLTGNFFEVKQVKVLVEGQDAPTIMGHYALGTSEASMPASTTASGPGNR